MLSWTFFKRYLFSARAGSLVKRIAWLSMVSIGVAVAAFILVLSIMSGLHRNINLRILALEPHLTAEFEKNIDDSIIQNHSIIPFLKQQRGLDFQIYDRQDVILRSTDGLFHGGVARGVTVEAIEAMQRRLSALPQQNTATAVLEVPGAGEVVLGYGLAKQLNVYEGEYVTILPPESLLMAPGENPPFAKVVVKQIVATNIAELDSQMVLFQRGQALVNFSKAGSRRVGYDVWLSDPYGANSLKKRLSQFKDLSVQTWRERNSAIFWSLQLEKLMLGSFLGLSALITTFSIWSVLTLLIAQKRKDMGLLMALGLSNVRLKDLFQRVGLYLAGIGLGVGALVGVLVGLYLEKFPLKVLPDIYYDSEIPAQVDFLFILIILALAIMIIYGAVHLAMKKLLELRPSEALRSN
ncbi:MAG: hypothetical protein RJB66_1955 [Pseudomonadota bacterium]|jgi:lipoprotein-releasing system permease protein